MRMLTKRLPIPGGRVLNRPLPPPRRGPARLPESCVKTGKRAAAGSPRSSASAARGAHPNRFAVERRALEELPSKTSPISTIREDWRRKKDTSCAGHPIGEVATQTGMTGKRWLPSLPETHQMIVDRLWGGIPRLVCNHSGEHCRFLENQRFSPTRDVAKSVGMQCVNHFLLHGAEDPTPTWVGHRATLLLGWHRR